MTARSIAHLLQASPATALPGTWKLARGRAITLQPADNGILRIAHGRVWATVDGPHGRTPQDSGDHVLEVGRSMWVRAGQRVVIEAWNSHSAAYFSFDPVAAPATRTVASGQGHVSFAGVLQPLADLRMAAAMALGATGRLGAGLLQLAFDLLPARASRPALQTCRAHGAMG